MCKITFLSWDKNTQQIPIMYSNPLVLCWSAGGLSVVSTTDFHHRLSGWLSGISSDKPTDLLWPGDGKRPPWRGWPTSTAPARASWAAWGVATERKVSNLWSCNSAKCQCWLPCHVEGVQFTWSLLGWDSRQELMDVYGLIILIFSCCTDLLLCVSSKLYAALIRWHEI